MATSNTNLRIAELDFDTIKLNLRNYLRSQSQFQDYDFEGSGLNTLLDILAYNTHYMSYYLNMVGNEMFLDSAILRDSVVSHAKMIGYTPNSKRAATAVVNITVTPPVGNSTSILTLPKYTQFQSEAIDGVNYSFVTLQSLTASKNVTSNTFTFANVTLYQGEHSSFDFAVTQDSPTTNYIIPSANIDTSTLIVQVQNSSVDLTTVTFTQASDITTVNANSLIFFTSAVENNQYAIYFGDGVIGKALSNGNIILTDYIDTDAELSNKANAFTITGPVGGFSNVITSTISAAGGGSDRETLDTTRFRAPITYATQGRAVTVNDYSAVIAKDYPNIDQISVWGGEDNIPIVYGKVFISLKPKNGYVLTTTEKRRIANEIVANRNVLTITPEIIDPDYLYVLIKPTVYYDQAATSLSAADLSLLVSQTIQNFASTQLEKFGSPFSFSRLQTAIDNTESSISSTDLSVKVQKRLIPVTGQSKNYTLNFGTELHRGAATDKLYTYPTFKTLDGNGILRTAYIEEVPLSYTGIFAVNVQQTGQNYTVPPTVVITGDGTGAKAIASITNGKVTSITVTQSGSGYSEAQVSFISNDDGSGATATATISTNYGTLQSVYYQTNGDKIIINANVGTIDYFNGIIKLNNFNPVSIDTNPYYPAGVLTFNIEPNNQRIVPLRNVLIYLDTSDSLSIQVNMVPV